RGVEPPENKNLSLMAVEEFQRLAREAQDLRRVSRTASDPVEQAYGALLYGQKKQKVDEYLGLGAPFEKAYREYIKSKNEYIHFSLTLHEIATLEGHLEEPSFASVANPDKKNELDERAHSRIEMVMRETDISTLLSH